MTRSLAPRPRTKPTPKPERPDPKAVHHYACSRCQRPIAVYGLASECFGCTQAAAAVFNLGPIQGELSGS